MGFLDAPSPLPSGTRGQPPAVSKFSQFLDNYLAQVQKSPTAQAGETAGIAIEEARDNTPVLDDVTRESWNKQIPNLNIAQGTREASARSILANQMKENLNTAIVKDPQNNSILAWSGEILGGVQRFILDPEVIVAALAGGAVGEGAALVGSRFLPETSALAKFFPQIARAVGTTGLEGGVFGFVDGMTTGEIEAKDLTEAGD